MNTCIIIFVCSIITQQVLGNEYQTGIATTTQIFGSVIKIYPGTPYDYVGTKNDTIQHTYINLGSPSTRLVAADVDYHRRNFYFFDTYTVSLYRIDDFKWESTFSNMTLHTVHSGISSSILTRVAVDWLTGNVYWTDPVYAWIGLQYGRSRENFTILIHEDMFVPAAIAVNPNKNYMFLYWSDIGPSVKIERSSLDGTHRTAIITTGLVTPISITVDYLTNNIVWVDEGRDTVEIADFMGEQRRIIRRLSHTTLFDVAVFRDYVMATDFNSGQMMIFNKNTGSVENFGPADGQYLTVKMYSNDTQSNNIANQCVNNTCEHICVNSITGRTCICHAGYTLNQDQQTCSEQTGVFHRALLQSNKTHICLTDVRRLSARHLDVINCIVTDAQNIAHFDIGMTSRKIMFADICTIYSVEGIDGTVKKDVFLTMEPCHPITGLALDWRDNNIYWTNSDGIHLVSQEKEQFTLIQTDIVNPRDLIIVPFQSLMIWISGTSRDFKIEKAKYDGSDRVTIVTSGSEKGPQSLIIDRNTELLYYIDGVVKSCTLDGGDLKSLPQADESAQPHRVLIYKNYLVLAERGYPHDTITSFDLKLGTRIFEIEDVMVDTTDIKVLDDIQQPDIPGPCDIMEGRCEQICLPIGQTRLCKCEFGYKLDDNRESCSSESLTDNFLVVTDWTHNRMYMVSLDTDVVTAVDTETFGSPIGVLYDNITKSVMWTTNNFLHGSHVDGSNYTIIRNTENIGCYFDRLAIDDTSGNIYFTAVPHSSSGNVGVGVIKPNGDYKFLIKEGVRPRSIVLDPKDGLLFWTDHSADPPFVKKANMDGTQIEFIKQSGLVWPNGLAIDTEGDILYVADGKTNIIHRCTYKGSCSNYYEDSSAHLMDIKLVGDYLYFTAWNNPYITKLHKDNVVDRSVLAQKAELGRLDSITYYSSTITPSVSSACKPKHGIVPCSTFCLPKPSGYTCACEEGVDLRDDDRTCQNVPFPTTSTTMPSTTSAEEDSTSPVYIYAGIGGAIGGVVLIALCAVLVCFILKKRRTRTETRDRCGFENSIDIATVYGNRHDGPEVHYPRQPVPDACSKRDTTYDLIVFDAKDESENKLKHVNSTTQNDYTRMDTTLSGDYECLMQLPVAPILPVSAVEGRSSDYLEPIPATPGVQSNPFLQNPLYQVD